MKELLNSFRFMVTPKGFHSQTFANYNHLLQNNKR